MKILKEGEEMPKDFWNYNVNPIVGYYVPKVEVNWNRDSKKYAKTPQGLK